MICDCGLQVYQFNVPTFGKGVVFDVDSKIRAEQFKFFASALQSSKLKSYIPLFAKESEVNTSFIAIVPRCNAIAILVEVHCLFSSHYWCIINQCLRC